MLRRIRADDESRDAVMTAVSGLAAINCFIRANSLSGLSRLGTTIAADGCSRETSARNRSALSHSPKRREFEPLESDAFSSLEDSVLLLRIKNVKDINFGPACILSLATAFRELVSLRT